MRFSGNFTDTKLKILLSCSRLRSLHLALNISHRMYDSHVAALSGYGLACLFVPRLASPQRSRSCTLIVDRVGCRLQGLRELCLVTPADPATTLPWESLVSLFHGLEYLTVKVLKPDNFARVHERARAAFTDAVAAEVKVPAVPLPPARELLLVAAALMEPALFSVVQRRRGRELRLTLRVTCLDEVHTHRDWAH